MATLTEPRAEYSQPLPDVDWPLAKPYWEGARNHELRIQRCSDCGAYRWYPKPMCPTCHSFKSEWPVVNGVGKVYSYTIGYRAFREEWRDRVPYIVVVVELDEVPNVRLLTNLLDCQPNEVHVGMPVDVFFQDVTPEVTLPQFKPIR